MFRFALAAGFILAAILQFAPARAIDGVDVVVAAIASSEHCGLAVDERLAAMFLIVAMPDEAEGEAFVRGLARHYRGLDKPGRRAYCASAQAILDRVGLAR